MAKQFRKYTREFRLDIIREVRQGDQSMRSIARKYSLSPTLVVNWLKEYDADPEHAFRRESVHSSNTPLRLENRVLELERMVGRLTMENDFLKKVIEKLDSLQEPDPSRAPAANNDGK